jgi:hypothetical protein
MFRRFPKGGAGVARLQVGLGRGAVPDTAPAADGHRRSIVQCSGRCPCRHRPSLPGPCIAFPAALPCTPLHSPAPLCSICMHLDQPCTVLRCMQVLLFSATLHSPEVRALAAKICQNPIIIDLKGKDAVPETGGLGGWVQEVGQGMGDACRQQDGCGGRRVQAVGVSSL